MSENNVSTEYDFRAKDCIVGAQMLFVAFGALVLVPLLTGFDPNVALFTAGVGTLIFQAVTKRMVAGLLGRFGRAAEIKSLGSHRLRHTLATLLINQGMPLTSLQHFLGHKKADMTMVYAKVYDETVRKQFASAMIEIEGIAVQDWSQDKDNLSVVDVQQELNLV